MSRGTVSGCCPRSIVIGSMRCCFTSRISQCSRAFDVICHIPRCCHSLTNDLIRRFLAIPSVLPRRPLTFSWRR
ncbi:hypothetical protein Hypma_003096 [Hypsizygus marmoreus]|uniref:Uncharacterized protein n=1 Tax=Hypsizygus marmoreus TaxID=39966 RepID=A0A369J2I9_HYPMA|nr:hypothetical protein Hypma_003096 [Hypsizygus marmoreus]